MNKMIYFLFVFLFIQSAYSQETSSDSCFDAGDDKPWAILLRYSNDFSFNSFEGANISMQRKIGENSAIRVGISISSDDNEGNSSSKSTTINTSDYSEGQSDNISFTIYTKYLYNIIKHRNIKFYLGSGPFYRYYNSTSTNEQNYFNTDTLTNRTYTNSETNQSNYGIELITGIEWSIKSYLSLLAEYGTEFSYRNITSERIRMYDSSGESIQKSESDGFSVASLPIKLGIAFKF
jgi:hypothetical protein